MLPVRPWQDVTAAHPRPRASSSPPWPFLIQEPPSAGDSQVPSRGRTVAGAGLSAGAHAGATRQPLCPRSPCHGGLRPPVRGACHRLGVRLQQACQHRSGGAQSAGPRAQDRGPRPACTPLALPARSGRGASRWRFVLAGCHPLTHVLAAALSRGATVIGVVGRSALRAICHELKLHADRFTQQGSISAHVTGEFRTTEPAAARTTSPTARAPRPGLHAAAPEVWSPSRRSRGAESQCHRAVLALLCRRKRASSAQSCRRPLRRCASPSGSSVPMVTGVPLFKAGRTRGQAPHAVRLKAGEERRFPGENRCPFSRRRDSRRGGGFGRRGRF